MTRCLDGARSDHVAPIWREFRLQEQRPQRGRLSINFYSGRLSDHMRGPHATEFITREGCRILIRPDGYIASIGAPPSPAYAVCPRVVPYS